MGNFWRFLLVGLVAAAFLGPVVKSRPNGKASSDKEESASSSGDAASKLSTKDNKKASTTSDKLSKAVTSSEKNETSESAKDKEENEEPSEDVNDLLELTTTPPNVNQHTHERKDSPNCPGISCVAPPDDVYCEDSNTIQMNPIIPSLGSKSDCCPTHVCTRKDGSIFSHYGIEGEGISFTQFYTQSPQAPQTFPQNGFLNPYPPAGIPGFQYPIRPYGPLPTQQYGPTLGQQNVPGMNYQSLPAIPGQFAEFASPSRPSPYNPGTGLVGSPMASTSQQSQTFYSNSNPPQPFATQGYNSAYYNRQQTFNNARNKASASELFRSIASGSGSRTSNQGFLRDRRNAIPQPAPQPQFMRTGQAESFGSYQPAAASGVPASMGSFQ